MKFLKVYITYWDNKQLFPPVTNRIFINLDQIVSVAARRRDHTGKILALNITFSQPIVDGNLNYEFNGAKNIDNILQHLGINIKEL